MAESTGGGGGGGGGGSGSTGSITDLGKYIKGIFGDKDASGTKLDNAGLAVKEYKELEKDYGGSALGPKGSAPASLNQPMQLNPSPQSKFGFDNNFYGHYLPSHFKKTSIINTKGRVR